MSSEEIKRDSAEVQYQLRRLGMQLDKLIYPGGSSYFTVFVTDKDGLESVIKVLMSISESTKEQFYRQLESSDKKGKLEYGDYLLDVERFPLGDFLALKMPTCKMSAIDYSGRQERTAEGVLKCALDLAKGTSVLHGLNLVHSKIHPANGLLLGNKWRLTDYSMTPSSGFYSSQSLTKAYWAPEIWRSDENYLDSPILPQFKFTFDSDIWALGAIFYGLMISQSYLPWLYTPETRMRMLKENEEEFKKSILNSDYKDGMTEEMAEFAYRMMHPDLSKRIQPIQKVIVGLERLLKSPY